MARVGFQRLARQGLRASAACLAILLPMGAAQAQNVLPPPPPPPTDGQPAPMMMNAEPMSAAPAGAPSTNAMVNLIRLLVKQGTITEANGNALLTEAQAEASQARANVVQAAANAGVPPPPEGTLRVPYVPAGVRKQIAEQVRTEVMAQAKSEGWAAPGNAAPDWTRRIKLYGDVRFRTQSELYSRNNSTDIIDIARLAAGVAPINLTDVQNLSVLNTTRDRTNRLRLRARIGLDAEITPEVKASFGIATGDDNGPISTNSALAGGLSKRTLWLDKAFVELRPVDGLKLDFGRFPNPFKSTQLLFDEDLHFDGVSAEFRADKWLPEGFSVALRGGAFPLDNGAENFPDTSDAKQNFPSKWLLSGQLQAEYATRDGLKIMGAVAYHDFSRVQGQLSSPCLFNGVIEKVFVGGVVAADPTECSTDWTRAMFPRKGNTMFFLRNIVVPGQNDIVAAERQYLGLVQPFRVLDFNTAVTVPLDDEVKATLSGNYLINLAYRTGNNCRYGNLPNPSVGPGSQPGIPINNVIPNSQGSFNPCLASNPAQMIGGNEGWMVDFSIGHHHPRKWGEWRLTAGYRYLQSDAVMDSFTDSDFHLGGTNAKGYTVFGSMGLFNGVQLGARWLSSNEIRGEPLSIDVLQIDLQAEF